MPVPDDCPRFYGEECESMIMKALVEEVEESKPDDPYEIDKEITKEIDKAILQSLRAPPLRARWTYENPNRPPTETREYVSEVPTGLLNAYGRPIYRVQRMKVDRRVSDESA